jgi:hypothetical protein
MAASTASSVAIMGMTLAGGRLDRLDGHEVEGIDHGDMQFVLGAATGTSRTAWLCSEKAWDSSEGMLTWTDQQTDAAASPRFYHCFWLIMPLSIRTVPSRFLPASAWRAAEAIVRYKTDSNQQITQTLIGQYIPPFPRRPYNTNGIV